MESGNALVNPKYPLSRVGTGFYEIKWVAKAGIARKIPECPQGSGGVLALSTYFSQKLSHFQFPRRCTNGRTGGTTRWPAELMYI